MSSVIATFPSVESGLLGSLGPAFPSSYRFCTILPANITGPTEANLTNPVIRIKRISGAARDIRVDRPIVDIDVFTSDYGNSDLIGRQIQAFLLTLRGTILLNGMGVIQGVDVVNGPRWIPDSDQSLFRSNATYEIRIHA